MPSPTLSWPSGAVVSKVKTESWEGLAALVDSQARRDIPVDLVLLAARTPPEMEERPESAMLRLRFPRQRGLASLGLETQEIHLAVSGEEGKGPFTWSGFPVSQEATAPF